MINYIRHRSSTDQLCLRVQVQWSQKVSKRWYLKSDCKDTRQTGGEGHLRTKEWKRMMLPGYFMPSRIVSNDNGERKLGQKDGDGQQRSKGQHTLVPKDQSSVPVWAQHLRQHPAPTGGRKGRTGGRHMGKGSQGTHQLTRRAWPPLPNMFSNSSLSTLTLTP